MFQPSGDLNTDLEQLLRQDIKYDFTREEGAAVLDLADEQHARYVSYRDVDRWANVLWDAHAWLMPCWYYSPRLTFISPLSNCGKTRAMTVTEHLVPHPHRSDRMTPASVYYAIEAQRDINGDRPTLLMDELDAIFAPRAGATRDEASRPVYGYSNFTDCGFPLCGEIGSKCMGGFRLRAARGPPLHRRLVRQCS